MVRPLLAMLLLAFGRKPKSYKTTLGLVWEVCLWKALGYTSYKVKISKLLDTGTRIIEMSYEYE